MGILPDKLLRCELVFERVAINQERQLKRDAWLTIGQTYTDEFGAIDREVLEAAGQIWPQAERVALGALRDAQAGHDLMIKACALVTRRRAAAPGSIENLPAYLYQTWRRLLLGELEKENRHRKQEAERLEPLLPSSDSPADDLDRKILIQQILRRMDAATRRIFLYRALGYTFEEIGAALGQSGDVVRATFNKQIKKLTKQLASERPTPKN
jgi:RNA polymerase sigma factor (sigma-70 family)